MFQAVRRRPVTAQVRVRSQFRSCEICGGWNGTENSAFPFQHYSINAPDSSSYTCCSYHKDKGVKRGNLLKNKGLWKIGAHWIEKYFHSGLRRLKGLFLRSITAYIYVKCARGPVFFVGTISWRRRDQQDETWRCRCTNESVFRLPRENSICQKLTTVQYNPLKRVPFLPFHTATQLHIMWTWDIWWRDEEGSEVVTKRRKWNIKKLAFKSVTKLLHNALLGFSCRSKSYKDFRADVKAYFRSTHTSICGCT